MAHEDFIHPIDDSDREAARGAADRTQVKAQVAHELIVDQLIQRGVDPETATSEKLQIAKELKDITATAERAKRQLANEGLVADNAPRIILNIGNRTLGVNANPSLGYIDGELAEMPELDEEWGA